MVLFSWSNSVTWVGLSTIIVTAVSAGGGMIAQVKDSTNFCVFLPPPGQMSAPLSDNEWDSQAYCIGNTPEAAGANTLPAGFIQSAHFVATDDYVQVTGQIDPSKVGLNPTDEGGQCDIMAPKGSSCAGWQYYVNLIEPAGNTYCMRCCNDPTHCNRGISQDGCAHVIPGDYSGPMDGSGSGAATPSSGSASSAASSPSASSSSPSPSSPVSSSSSSSAAILTSLPIPSALSSAGSPSAASLPLPSPGSSGSPAKGAPPNGGSGSQSGQLGQSSITAQSVNHASSTVPLGLATTIVGSVMLLLINA